FGQEALSIARTLDDRSIAVPATNFLGLTHLARGDFNEAVAGLERNVALEDDLRYERFGAPAIQSVLARTYLAEALSQLGWFEKAVGLAETAVQIAETADHHFTLYIGLIGLALPTSDVGISRTRPGSSNETLTSAARGSSTAGHSRSPQPSAPPTPSPVGSTRRSRWWRTPSKSSAVARFTT